MLGFNNLFATYSTRASAGKNSFHFCRTSFRSNEVQLGSKRECMCPHCNFKYLSMMNIIQETEHIRFTVIQFLHDFFSFKYKNIFSILLKVRRSYNSQMESQIISRFLPLEPFHRFSLCLCSSNSTVKVPLKTTPAGIRPFQIWRFGSIYNQAIAILNLM